MKKKIIIVVAFILILICIIFAVITYTNSNSSSKTSSDLIEMAYLGAQKYTSSINGKTAKDYEQTLTINSLVAGGYMKKIVDFNDSSLVCDGTIKIEPLREVENLQELLIDYSIEVMCGNTSYFDRFELPLSEAAKK